MGGAGKKNGGDAKKWQVWTAAAPDVVFYRIQDSRSTEAARQLLGRYRGTVVCEDYSAYESLRKRGGEFQLGHCWAHVRRKFIDAEGEAPKECAEAIAMIAELYAIAKRANTGPPEERARLRNDESRAIVKRTERVHGRHVGKTACSASATIRMYQSTTTEPSVACVASLSGARLDAITTKFAIVFAGIKT